MITSPVCVLRQFLLFLGYLSQYWVYSTDTSCELETMTQHKGLTLSFAMCIKVRQALRLLMIAGLEKRLPGPPEFSATFMSSKPNTFRSACTPWSPSELMREMMKPSTSMTLSSPCSSSPPVQDTDSFNLDGWSRTNTREDITRNQGP